MIRFKDAVPEGKPAADKAPKPAPAPQADAALDLGAEEKPAAKAKKGLVRKTPMKAKKG